MDPGYERRNQVIRYGQYGRYAYAWLLLLDLEGKVSLPHVKVLPSSIITKIGNSTDTGIASSPMWSYQLGLENGWIPADPRDAVGTCDTLDVPFNTPFNGSYPSWQTGGAGAGTIAPTATAALEEYPPTLSNAMNANPTLLPHYTDVSANPTLPAPTFSAATTTGGDGWADAQDTMLAPAPVPGCVYPDAWAAPQESTSFVCGAAATASATS